jgi:hypothetical protein
VSDRGQGGEIVMPSVSDRPRDASSWSGCRESTLLIGRTRDELQPIVQELLASGELRWVESIFAALALPRTDDFAHILLAPAWRDEFSAGQILELAERFPLACQTVLVSSWLEGETRSGQPWPGVQRWYLDQAVARLQRRRARQNTGAARWIPPTQSSDELWQAETELQVHKLKGTALVVAEQGATQQYLAELFEAWGMQAVMHDPEQRVGCSRVATIVYDAVAERARSERHVQTLHGRHPEARLITLLNFPRPHEIARLKAAGATAVLGKPFLNNDLHALIAPPSAS